MKKYLEGLKDIGILITLKEDDSLHIRAQKGVMTASILERLKTDKEAIIAYLKYGVGKVYMLSYAQERLWFLDRFEEGKSTAYHMPSLVKLTGDVDIDVLKQAFKSIVERHEVLRTQFIQKEEEVFVKIGDPKAFQVEVFVSKASEIHERVHQVLDKPFDLEKEMLFKAQLYTIDTKEHYLFVTMHHSISDGWSIGIMIQEFLSLYTAYRHKQENPLPALEIQYGDYAAWQRTYLKEEVLEEKVAFWRTYLQGVEPLALPTTYPRPALQSYHGDRVFFSIPASLTGKLYEISKTYDATLFMTLLSIFGLLLHKYTQQEEIVIGSPIANRNRTEIEPLIGFFVNTLALKQSFRDKLSFSSVLSQTKTDILQAYEHQDLPFEKVVEALHIQRDASRSPLFQSMFILQNHADYKLELDNMHIENVKLDNPTSKFDITMELQEVNGVLEGSLEYATALFSKSYIEAMVGHFTVLLEAICKDETKEISSYSLLTKEEENTLLVTYNDTAEAYDKERLLHQDFEAQAVKTPEAIAVVYEDEYISYQALNEKANQLAHYLIAQGVKVESLVAICVERSMDMIVGILAILKAGGAYVPIDPHYPKDRIAYMLEDSQATRLLTQAQLKERFVQHQDKIIVIDSLDNSQEPNSNPDLALSSSNLAYVIYTSGSTGLPKGVMIEHQNTLALIDWAKKTFDIKHFAHTLASTSFTFDLSVFEMFVPLSVGTTMYIVPNALVFITDKNKYPITCINTVPSVIRELHYHAAIPNSVALVCLAGEKLKQELVDTLYSNQQIQDIYDLYGPSEDTTYTTYTRRALHGVENIGRPIHNTQLYILDAQLQLIPKGVFGELHIAGEGLARGYLNQPTLTEEKFIPNPFSKGTRLYKTGDLVRYLEDGNIAYMGRIDDQVKLRGFRIELGEIEQQILHIEGVKESVVLVREEEDGHRYLVAYITSQEAQVIEKQEIKNSLSQVLPEYMVPKVYKLLDTMPLMPNGKVDKKALMDIEISLQATQEYVAPRDKTEETLAAIFSKVLKVEKVGIEDNFFELGGDSLLIIQIVSLAKQAQIPLEVRDVFTAQTIADLSRILKQDSKVIEEPISIKEEVVLAKEISPIGPLIQKENIEKVLLTGATGFLGSYLLATLLKKKKTRVYCLVRCTSASEGAFKVKEVLKSFHLWEEGYASWIHIIPGDLSKVKLGIESDSYATLAKEISTVYHSATHMNTIAGYETLKQVNVAGLTEMLKFLCLTQQKRLEYISTADVFSYETQSIADEHTSLSTQIHYPVKGYASSKFISENMILEAQKRGIAINIYRIGLITGDTVVGKNEETQWLYPLLKGIREVGCIVDMPKFELSMSPVDFVATSIVALANASYENEIFHINSPFLLNFMDLVKLKGFEIVDLYTFLQRLQAYNQAHTQDAYFSTYFASMFPYSLETCKKIEQTFDITAMPIFSVAEVKTFVRSFQTRERLKKLNISFPEINEALIDKYFMQSSL